MLDRYYAVSNAHTVASENYLHFLRRIKNWGEYSGDHSGMVETCLYSILVYAPNWACSGL